MERPKPRTWVEWQREVPDDARFPFYVTEWVLQRVACELWSFEMKPGAFRLSARLSRVVAGGTVLVGLVLTLWLVPPWQAAQYADESQRLDPELVNRFRTTLAQILGGFALLFGLYLTYRRITVTEENVRLVEEGQITERFTRAVEQLGKTRTEGGQEIPTLEIRLGGIYALERIAKDSPRDHWTVMEVLTAYVRENAKWNGAQALGTAGAESGEEDQIAQHDANLRSVARLIPGEAPWRRAEERKPRADVQAVLTVIGRRNTGGDDWGPLDLRDTDLRGAELQGADLEGANLIGAHLEGADLFEARLEGANLKRAHLERALLIGAHLEGAWLMEAYLEGAALQGAHLEGALLIGVHLEGADLHDTDLRSALYVTCEQLVRARNWKTAYRDENLACGAPIPEPPEERK